MGGGEEEKGGSMVGPKGASQLAHMEMMFHQPFINEFLVISYKAEYV